MLKSPSVLGTSSAVAIVLLATTFAAQRPEGPRPVKSAQARGEQRRLTREQIARVDQKVAIATDLVSRFEPEAKRLGRGAGWRQATLESLLSLSMAGLQEVQSAHSVDDLAAAIATAAVETSAIGDSTEDLVYKPIPPCRYIDTRNIAGKISDFRGYDLSLAGSTYGGSATCAPVTLFGVNENQFGGIAMNVTIIDPSAAPGFVAVKPTLIAPVSSLVNWYEAGATVQVANQAILTMDQGGSTAEFWVQASAPVHAIVDIFGAFIAPEATALESVYADFSTLVSGGSWTSWFSGSCPSGYRLTGGGVVAPGSDFTTVMQSYAEAPAGSARWICGVRNSGVAAMSVTCRAICSRTPGR